MFDVLCGFCFWLSVAIQILKYPMTSVRLYAVTGLVILIFYACALTSYILCLPSKHEALSHRFYFSVRKHGVIHI